MSREAMKLALEALESGKNHGVAIDVLRRALAEPQEKYIYGTPLLDAMTGKANEALDKMAENARELGLDYEPAQPQKAINKYCCHLCFNNTGQLFLDRMILCPECGNKRCPKATHHSLACTKSNDLGQKGSIYDQPAQQEPVACLVETEQGVMLWPIEDINEAENYCEENEFPVLLYTSPPAQRTWVDLTDDEIKKEFHPLHATGLQFARAVLAKSKEKNA